MAPRVTRPAKPIDQPSLDATMERARAENAATAAVQHSSSAFASETAAGQSASAAETAKVQAETAKGLAETAETNAATSESNAAGSASSASSSASVAASTKDEVEKIERMTERLHFNSGADYWVYGYTWDAATLVDMGNIVDAYGEVTLQPVTGIGTVLQCDGTYRVMSERGARPIVDGQKIRVTVKTRLTRDPDASAGTHTTRLYIAGLHNGEYKSYTLVDTYYGLTVAGGWVEWVIDMDPAALRDADGGTFGAATEWRLMYGLNGNDSDVGNAIQQVANFKVDDVTSELAALGHASAAATSASTAAASENAAGQSASSATTAKNAAETARGAAETAETNAAISESNAAGSASSASSSASVAASAKTTALMLEGNPDFSSGYEGWAPTYVKSSTPLGTYYGDIGTYHGRANVFAATVGKHIDVGQNKAWMLVPGRKYRMRGSFMAGGPDPVRIYMGVSCVDTSGTQTGSNSGLNYIISTTFWEESQGWQDMASAPFTLADMQAVKGAAVAGVRLICFLNYHNVAGCQGFLDGMWLEDVTASEEAADSASAAATSASTAAASESAAGSSASSATTAKNAAETAKGQAESAATSAATSESNAAGSANSAASSATVAASTKASVIDLYGNSDFEFDLEGWRVYNSWTANGTSSGHSDTYAAVVSGGQTADKAIRLTGTRTMHSNRMIPVDTARVYRGRWRVRCPVASPEAARIYPGVATYDAALGHQTSGAGTNRYFVAGGSITVPNDGAWYEYTGTITGEGALHEQFRAGTKFVTLQLLAHLSQPSSTQVEVDFMSFEDVTEAEQAADSASAAASSASSAAASESAAGSSASSATTAKNAAETAKGQAESAATAAATSESNAQGSANSASTSASNAATSANNAGDSASAASTSASTAATKATEAGTSASAADSAKTAAETAKGQAQTHASNAATSESNASGSANSASTSAGVAATARDAAVMIERQIERQDFNNGAGYWLPSYTQSKSVLATSSDVLGSYPDVTLETVAGEGTVLQANANYRVMSERKTRPYIAGQKIRVTVRLRLTRDPDPGFGSHIYYMWMTKMSGGVYDGYNGVGTRAGLTVADGWVEDTFEFLPEALNAGTDEWRLMVGLNGYDSNGVGGAISQVSYIRIEDITQTDAAEVHAQAAATSASTASTKAGEASTSASAANTSKVAAETAKGLAQTAESNAVTAYEDADTAKVAAISAKDTAVAVSSQGTGVLTDQFSPCGVGWVEYISGATTAANEVYPTGSTVSFVTTASTNPSSYVRSGDAVWTGMDDATGYRVEIEFELVSGSISGAGFLFDWQCGSNYRKDVPLSDMVDQVITTGKLYTGSIVVERPSNATPSTFQYNRVYFMTNWGTLGTKVAKNIKVHRIQFYPISMTEAKVSEHTSTIADLEGNASAGYLVKAQAGSSVSLLDLVAADGVGGPVSVAKLSADEIILDGTVTASKLLIEPNNLLENGHFMSGDLSGWRPWSQPSNVYYYRNTEKRGMRFACNGSQTSCFSGTEAYTDANAYNHAMPLIGGKTYKWKGQIFGYVANELNIIMYYWKSETDGINSFTIANVYPVTAWTPHEYEFTMPSDAIGGYLYVRSRGGATGNQYVVNMSIKEMDGADLIVNGGIKADSLQIDNVTLDTDGNGNLIIKSGGVDRGQIAQGGVTDGGTFGFYPSGVQSGDNNWGTSEAIMGALSSDNFWTLAWAMKYRHHQYTTGTTGGKGSSTYHDTWKVRVRPQIKYQINGSWGTWQDVGDWSPWSTDVTAWDQHTFTTVVIGDYTNMTMRYITDRALFNEAQSGGNTGVQNSIKDLNLIGKAIIR